MENLNDLIWMDEDVNKGNGTQSSILDPPMLDICLVCLCTPDSPGDSGYIDMGSNAACTKEAIPYNSKGCQ